MEKINQLIEIVYDQRKRKLRARCIQDGRWVRFPNKLRIENKVYKAAKMKKGRGDSWIASGPTEFDFEKDGKELEEVLGLKNKLIIKEFYQALLSEDFYGKKVNTEMLNIIFTVKNICPEMDEQLMKPLIKRYEHSSFILEDYLLDVKNMLMNYNDKRIISLFANYEQDDFLEDCAIMYKRLFENDITIDDILPKKPKKLREIHELFTRECSKIREPKSLLHQSLNQLKGVKCGKYDIFIPESSYDLIDIGNALGICVGNGYYAKKVSTKRCNIIALKEKENFKYCIEFDKAGFIQCRGYSNRNMETELRNELSEVVFPKKSKKSA